MPASAIPARFTSRNRKHRMLKTGTGRRGLNLPLFHTPALTPEGREIVALRIKGKGSVFQDVPVTGALSPAPLETILDLLPLKGAPHSRRRRIIAPGGLAFAG